jgi:hypothetical protein
MDRRIISMTASHKVVGRITKGKLPPGADEFTALPRSFIAK